MVQKVVYIKVKRDLKSNIMIWNINTYYFKGYCLFYNSLAKVQTQNTTIYNFYPKKLKAKKLKPLYTKIVEPLE